ncbi:MAG: hypothetical protein KGJ23_12615 [Euryarchaeota archaeon]|nr:hypothetical protein [Euryarchaeota archaeon]MDE1837441.1 hypothetical protein [Euryarchaeota archaeon]MDE1882004.1 hypothetical protein [Euryarchaeota archaeon]MDE2045593.1 hypothetical protein [Thermoplasmata archaeon]
MRLRTVTGNRYQTRCQCGSCSEVIPPSDTIKVVIDLDLPAGKRTYLFEHSPDAGKWKGNGGSGSSAQPAPSNGGNGHATGLTDASLRGGGPRDASSLGRPGCPPSSFTPASSLPAPAPKAPEPPRAPAPPPPLALLGSDTSHNEEEASASPQAGRAWSSGGLTVNPGKFESVRAGYADYALPGETAEQLAVRVNAVIEADLRSKLALLVKLHREFGIPGPEYHRPTSSPPASAGAPQGALATPPSPPSMIVPSATPAAEGAGARPSPQGAPVGSGLPGVPAQTRPDARALEDLVHDVRLELSDASPLRLSRKEKVWVDWLQRRGYSSLHDVRVGDEWGLGRVLDEFEAINRRGGP